MTQDTIDIAVRLASALAAGSLIGLERSVHGRPAGFRTHALVCLGAGVIFKEGLTVRGLTTAASIWITAAIGILYGVGFFYPAILGTLATLGTLAAFRWIETRIPTHIFAHHLLRFAKGK